MTDLAHPDRLAKIATLRAQGQDPYPARGVVATAIAQALAGVGTAAAPGPMFGQVVTLAGRMLQTRDFGKLMFAPLIDRTGQLQIGFQRDKLAAWWPDRKLLDAGDQIAVTGELGHTQKGEPTLWATEVRLLAKSVAPPPEKWHGLVDKELRYRRRYVDLWASEGVLQVFEKRSKVLSTIRHYLESEGYIEVETPTLHPIAGGATARPFTTHHNALDMELFLRIAPELYLKRLIVGGLERVFEVSRNFRNEGLSPRHNPEFTMLELYEAQADYRRMMELTERMFELCARAANGTTRVTFRGKDYDFAGPWPRISYVESFQKHNGFDPLTASVEQVNARMRALGIDPDRYAVPRDAGPSHLAYWKAIDAILESSIGGDLEGPVFLVDYPVQISPLAKQKPEDPRLTERFEVYIAGMELGNAFTELNDPAEQARRFEEQVASKDPEAPGEVDWDYVQALEYGMPPTGGLGIGIDRLVMVITGQDSIRDVLLFPAMKPQANAPAEPAHGATETAQGGLDTAHKVPAPKKPASGGSSGPSAPSTSSATPDAKTPSSKPATPSL